MIHLTRLNKHPLIVNSDLIKLIENAPDTMLTLVTGEKIVVLESSDQIVEKIVEFRRQIISGLATQVFGAGSLAADLAPQNELPAEKG
jgi:flagellar protein FlbD